MEVQSYHRMPPQYASQAQALQAACNAFDGTCWDLASFSLFNLYPAMPAFFLAFERGALIGVLQLRADETDSAESVCLVLPTARHRGVFTALLARASAALVRFGYRHVLLCRGRAYAQKHPLPGHLHALPAGRTLCLSRPAGLCEGAGSVRLAQCGDVPRLAQIGCDAFAESAEKSCAISAARWTAQTPRCTCWSTAACPPPACAPRAAPVDTSCMACACAAICAGRALRAPRWPAF